MSKQYTASSVSKGDGLDKFVVKQGNQVVAEAKNLADAKKQADDLNRQHGHPPLYS